MNDVDGSFTGKPRAIISANTYIGDAEGMRSICSFKPAQNVYYCDTTDMGVIEFEGISPDRRKLQSAPVYVENDVWKNKLNLFREWEWQGPEPLNLRQNSFNSIIQFNKTYNITYSGNRVINIKKIKFSKFYAKNYLYF